MFFARLFVLIILKACYLVLIFVVLNIKIDVRYMINRSTNCALNLDFRNFLSKVHLTTARCSLPSNSFGRRFFMRYM